MSARSVFILLRFPFSFFLAPIALIALALSPAIDPWRSGLILFILHGLVYPASNGFNSWCDRDEGPIGGIEHPPEPTRGLLHATLAMDLAALALGFLISPWFSLGLLAYILSSRAYSWPPLRLKARPLVSLFMICIGQGSLVFLLVSMFSLPGNLAFLEFIAEPGAIGGTVLAGLFLAGMYPLGQVYQHEEDKTRGDFTYSRLVGIRGTFLSSGIFLSLALGGLAVFFWLRWSLLAAGIFLAFTGPAALVFFSWWKKVARDPRKADFKHLMVLNICASTGMNLFLILILMGFFRS